MRSSGRVSCGCVSAAVLGASGRIYTGICDDTCAGLGICAERNALFHMLTEGEDRFTRVLAVMPDGKAGPPCGACRELMSQLMPGGFREVEILLDYENGVVKKLGELTPDWWL